MKQTWRPLLLGSIFILGIARADVLDNWTTNQITTNSFKLNHIVYGNGRYVAAGEQGDAGGIFSSEDGSTWILRYSDNNAWGLTLTYSGGRFVGVGGWETAISTNGTNWTVSFLPTAYGYFNYPFGYATDMTCGNGLYVAVGDTNNVGFIITSTDAVNWTPRNSSPAIGGHIQSVAYGASKFVAVGNNDGLEYTSTTGTGTWTRRSIPGGNQISFGNGLFIVPLTGNSNLLSTDGINWSMQNTGLTNKLGKVTYASGLFLARLGNYLVTSSDGTNWLQYPQQLPGNVTGDATVATDGKRLLTMGRAVVDILIYNSFVYSSDVLVSVRQTNKQPSTVVLSGLVGRNYQIQSTENLKSASSNWRTNTAMQLTNTPFVWTDPAPTNTARFYRGVLLP